MNEEEAELFLNVRYSDINRIRNYYGKQIEELQKENQELKEKIKEYEIGIVKE